MEHFNNTFMPAANDDVQCFYPGGGSARRIIPGESVGIYSRNSTEIIQTIKSGLPVSAFDMLQKKIDISATYLAKIININPRTLTRRRKQNYFLADESERLLRLGRLFDRARHLMGDDDKARKWFKTPKVALNNKTPLEFADTEPGAIEVTDLLGRLEHGVFA